MRERTGATRSAYPTPQLLSIHAIDANSMNLDFYVHIGREREREREQILQSTSNIFIYFIYLLKHCESAVNISKMMSTWDIRIFLQIRKNFKQFECQSISKIYAKTRFLAALNRRRDL